VSTASDIWATVKETAVKWDEDNISRWSASLSFYALLSMAPLLIVTVFLLGFIFGENTARVKVVHATTSIMGPYAASAIEIIAKNAHASGQLGPVMGMAIALFGASGLFVELQSALNSIWAVPCKKRSLLLGYFVGRLWSFLMVFCVSLVLLASVISNAVLAVIGQLFQDLLPGGGRVWQLAHSGAQLLIATILLSLVYRYVPETEIDWRDVWLGEFFVRFIVCSRQCLIRDISR
jgi:membrane protein